ncbi:hypothetical protein [Streptomyces odontomachi]|uniref:hypothetical protein n=1 Tax=Streptomyces odontomachi TaxID=2944940 RepID=UPI00210A21CD|nr:hypothetical protein [Streptomyces sp. ODS25]
MTSASLPARVRLGALAGGLIGALVLTGCGSSDDDGDKGADSSSSATASPSKSADDSGGSGGEAAKGSIEGSWVATTGGNTVALVITKGKAGLFASDGNSCSGTGGEEMGMKMIHLKCTKGHDRGEGMVKSVNATTMVVSWEGFGDESYTKSKDGQLPEGLPTAGMPSS